MTRQAWIDRANEYYAKAREAYDRGDTTAGTAYELRGNACMSNADYGTEVEWPREVNP